MKYYLVKVKKMGAFIKHPKVGHKKYKNAGYDDGLNDKTSNKAKCIWITEDNIDLVSDAEKNGFGDKIKEITEHKAQEYMDKWQK